MKIYDVIPVPRLEAPQLLVKQWRQSRGTETRTGYTTRGLNKHRVAWGPQEAADLAGVPSRTVSEWRRLRIVEPSFFDEQRGIVEGQNAYCSTDLLRLRLVADLRYAGVPMGRAESVSDNVYEACAYDPERPLSLEHVLSGGERWLIPADEATCDLMRKELFAALIVTDDPAHITEDDEALQDLPDLNLLEYPIRKRVTELRQRVAAWWTKAGKSADRRPPWMI